MLLYDLTSTYFEGEAEEVDKAQRGYSRDHRPDCKQIIIALVVTPEGFPLSYEVFAGNRAEQYATVSRWRRRIAPLLAEIDAGGDAEVRGEDGVVELRSADRGGPQIVGNAEHVGVARDVLRRPDLDVVVE